MSDIKLFRLSGGTATELQGNASDLEKPLQTLIEANLQPLLNIRFIASEQRKATADDLWRFAKICRVANVMRPYLEALGHGG